MNKKIDNDWISTEKFSDINLNDPFFDSLKSDYQEFSDWFQRKSSEKALVARSENANEIIGFLYLKQEDGDLSDISPNLNLGPTVKIGTFKINPHGTRLGERFLKKCFDYALDLNAESLYVTIFEKHISLLYLFVSYGFSRIAQKETKNGTELVLLKKISNPVTTYKVSTYNPIQKVLNLNYPLVPLDENRHFILSIYPMWHSRLLPDSLLNNEDFSIVKDVSYTNSIQKIYLTAMAGVEKMQPGDTLLIYRTTDRNSPQSAEYQSVVTSLCVVVKILNINQFMSEDHFVHFCNKYSVFTKDELTNFYRRKNYPWIICFTYNFALKKRVTRHELIEYAGIERNQYWGFVKITTEQFKSILKLSQDYEKMRSLIYKP